MEKIKKIKGIRNALKIIFIICFAESYLFLVKCSRRNNNHKIYISGNIEMTEVDIAFKSPGKLAELKVNEGDKVKKGMIITYMDQEELLRERDRASAVLAAAKAREAQLTTRIQYEREIVKGQIELRQAELRQEDARLRETESGSRVQEIEKKPCDA